MSASNSTSESLGDQGVACRSLCCIDGQAAYRSLAPALILYNPPQLWLFLRSGDGCDRAFGFRKQAQIELLYRFER